MLSEFQRAQAERLLAPLCVVPPQAKDELKVVVQFEAYDAILLEARPSYRDPEQWLERPIAKFTFVGTTKTWRLFCLRRDGNWHSYEPLPESPDLATLVAEVRADPTGIFRS
jgi:hypothetical protein